MRKCTFALYYYILMHKTDCLCVPHRVYGIDGTSGSIVQCNVYEFSYVFRYVQVQCANALIQLTCQPDHNVTDITGTSIIQYFY